MLDSISRGTHSAPPPRHLPPLDSATRLLYGLKLLSLGASFLTATGSGALRRGGLTLLPLTATFPTDTGSGARLAGLRLRLTLLSLRRGGVRLRLRLRDTERDVVRARLTAGGVRERDEISDEEFRRRRTGAGRRGERDGERE